MKKIKAKTIVIISLVLVAAVFTAIFLSVKFKYNNKYVRELADYKKVNPDNSNELSYIGLLNNYYDYEQESMFTMYLLYDTNEDIYELLGNIRIKSKAKKASSDAEDFTITYRPTYPANNISFRFHGGNLVIDGEEYKVEGLDELKAYIDEHTMTTDDVIIYAGEDKEAINDEIKKVWNEGQAASREEVFEKLPEDIKNSITAKIFNGYYMYSTTNFGEPSEYFPVKDGFYMEIGSYGTVRLYSLKSDVEPILIDGNQEEVKKFLENLK